MNNFFRNQIEKEKTAAKRVWSGYLKILIIFWGIIGIIMLFSPAWLFGIIFVGGAFYVWYRTRKK